MVSFQCFKKRINFIIISNRSTGHYCGYSSKAIIPESGVNVISLSSLMFKTIKKVIDHAPRIKKNQLMRVFYRLKLLIENFF